MHEYRPGAGAVMLLSAALLLVSCQRPAEHRAEFFVFGTLVEIKTWGVPERQAERAFTDLQRMFQEWHRDWHAWEPGLLADINSAFAAGRSIAADQHVIELIRRSQAVEGRTGGRFNPAIGGLVDLWGFHTSVYPIVGPPPDRAAIEKLVATRPSSLDIHIDGTRLSSVNPSVRLDFGGIAKGYAVDLAVARLRELGISNAMVNAGGDLRAMGRRGERPWRVAIRKPGGGVIGALEVQGDEALFTSGNYERFRQDRDRRYPHILDPRSGWPVDHVASATVVADEGVLADAAATALVVAGPDAWHPVIRDLQLERVLLIDESGMVHMTPAMAQRLKLTGDVPHRIMR